MIFEKDERYRVRHAAIEDYEGIREACLKVYPTAKPWQRDQFESQLKVFPFGQVVLEDHVDRVIVGTALSLIIRWDDYECDGSWRDFTDGGYFTNHDPLLGKTLYGAEIFIQPSYQGKGLGKKLYAARKKIVDDLGLLRIRAGARLRGYGTYAKELSPTEYVHRVVKQEIFDPTVSFQIKQGFQVIDVVSEYLKNDPESLGFAAIIEWLNPATARPKDFEEQIAFMRKIEG